MMPSFPIDSRELENFGAKSRRLLSKFYGQTLSLNKIIVPPLVNKDAQLRQYML